MSDEPLKFISLFSGVGVFDLALENAGFECVAVCEIDRNAQNILRRHYPHAKMYDDVRKVKNETRKTGTIDLICGGPPCQDFSVAGKRKGIGGERSGLWFEFARVIDEFEPRWVTFENVPGLYSSWSPTKPAPREVEVRDFHSREEAERWASSVRSEWIVEESNDFETIISFFQERGYCVAWRVLDSQHFGVPQRRRRIFLVASFGEGSCCEVLFERERLSGDTQESVESGKIASTISSSGARTSRTGNGNEAELLVFDWQSGGDVRQNISDKPMLQGSQTPAILSFDQAQITSPENRTNMVPDAPTPTLNGEGRLSIFMAGQGSKARSVAESDSLSPTLKSSNSGLNQVPSVAVQENALSGNGSAKWAKGTGGPAGDEVQNLVVADLAPTLESGYASKQGGDQQFISQNGDEFPVQNGGVRRLTPTECERLQGLPDGWTAWGIDVSGKRVEQADSPRYKQCGNAVTRNPVEWIARRIRKVSRG